MSNSIKNKVKTKYDKNINRDKSLIKSRGCKNSETNKRINILIESKIEWNRSENFWAFKMKIRGLKEVKIILDKYAGNNHLA